MDDEAAKDPGTAVAEVRRLEVLSATDDDFCLAIIEYGGNLGAAYRAVFGPDVNNATAKARQMVTRPEIAKRINALQRSVDDTALISIGAHMDQLAQIRDHATLLNMPKVALEAEKSRGVVAGYYKDKVPTPEGGTPRVNIYIGGSSPTSIEDWGKQHGNPPVIIENGK